MDTKLIHDRINHKWILIIMVGLFQIGDAKVYSTRKAVWLDWQKHTVHSQCHIDEDF